MTKKSYIKIAYVKGKDALNFLRKISQVITEPFVRSKKGVLKMFVKFTGKRLCWSLVFSKGAGSICNLIKKDSDTLRIF